MLSDVTRVSTEDGFLAVTETLVSATRQGARVIEYPVKLGAREFGESKMRVARVMKSHLGLLSKVVRQNVTGNGSGVSAGGRSPREELEPLQDRLILVGRLGGKE